MNKLEEVINQFQSFDYSFRLDLLLDYADKLPELPDKYHVAREAGLNRIHECQTPVFLWVEVEEGQVKLFADVAEQAPTVQGYVSILVNTLTGLFPEQIQELPNDVLFKLGLGQHLGMVRVQGLSAILPRIKKEVRKAVESEAIS
ncbi:MAG: SufE family protein [Aliifodinibius sp.]|nr:SufE family protein [Fodinibius sp.]NIW47449.1 SufE family protein [Gammaproteobacteria bacterium]NIY28741.1 SufE family protein [Fodinibius sp.]